MSCSGTVLFADSTLVSKCTDILYAGAQGPKDKTFSSQRGFSQAPCLKCSDQQGSIMYFVLQSLVIE